MNQWIESIRELWALPVILGKIIWILLILIGMKLVTKAGIYLMGRIFHLTQNDHVDLAQVSRTNTIKSILESLIRYMVGFIGLVTILDILGVPVMAVLSAAGVVGVAVGFGAQTLVKDVIAGFFILIENQYAVGDYVRIQNIDGTVEAMELRTTRIRSIDGELYIIPNGTISIVTNYYRGSLKATVEVGVAYDSNMDQVIRALERAALRIETEMADFIEEKPVVSGLWRMDESALIFRVTAKVNPRERIRVETALRRRVKEELDLDNINIPYPHQEIIVKEAAK
jgi:small conductance mechanosensitive channel